MSGRGRKIAFSIFRSRYSTSIRFHTLDGRFVVSFAQVPTVLASSVHTRTVEHHFMYVSSRSEGTRQCCTVENEVPIRINTPLSAALP